MGSKRIGVKPNGQALFEYNYVPVEMMAFVAEMTGAKTFVETGTEYGNTTDWAIKNFETVYTVEASKHFFEFAKRRFEKYKPGGPTIFHGESQLLIPMCIDKYLKKDEKVVWWLDAHFTPAEDSAHYYNTKNHPLVEELFAITRLRNEQCNYIFIDDFRYIAYPYTPMGSEQIWPSLQTIIALLDDYIVAIYGDFIVALPDQYSWIYDDWKQSIKNTNLDVL